MKSWRSSSAPRELRLRRESRAQKPTLISGIILTLNQRTSLTVGKIPSTCKGLWVVTFRAGAGVDALHIPLSPAAVHLFILSCGPLLQLNWSVRWTSGPCVFLYLCLWLGSSNTCNIVFSIHSMQYARHCVRLWGSNIV